jgi:hypothetical protein
MKGYNLAGPRADPEQPVFDGAPMAARVRATIWAGRLAATAVAAIATIAAFRRPRRIDRPPA